MFWITVESTCWNTTQVYKSEEKIRKYFLLWKQTEQYNPLQCFCRFRGYIFVAVQIIIAAFLRLNKTWSERRVLDRQKGILTQSVSKIEIIGILHLSFLSCSSLTRTEPASQSRSTSTKAVGGVGLNLTHPSTISSKFMSNKRFCPFMLKLGPFLSLRKCIQTFFQQENKQLCRFVTDFWPNLSPSWILTKNSE